MTVKKIISNIPSCKPSHSTDFSWHSILMDGYVYSYVATLQALMLSCLYVEYVESVQQFLAPTIRILYMLKANPENSQRQNTLRKRHCFYDPIMQNEKKTVILSTFPTNSDHQRGKSDNCNYHNKISDDNIEIIHGLKP